MSYELASLKSALGTTYGRENSRGVEDGTLYQYYLDSMSGGCNNPGDSATNHANSPGLFYADLYNSSVLAGAIKEWHEKLNGTFGGVLDLLYLRPELLKNEKIQLDLDKFFSGKETQMITTREGWDNKNQMYASWAGGGVQGGHNHCDVGSFVYDVNGYRFASDLGAVNYTYSGDPWDYFRRRAESHNVMVINPDKSGDFGLKKPGQDLDGWGTVKYVKKGSGGIVSAIDMQDVYKEQTSSYIRGFMTGDNRRTLTVRDEIVLKQNNSELYWNLMTLGDITVTGTNTATITRGNQPVKLEFETNAAEFKLEKTAAEPYEFSPHPTDGKTNDGIYSRVLITMKASGKFYITAKLSPMGEPAELSGIPQGTIDEWQPPEMTQVTSVDTSGYKLNNITVDGKTIAGFNSDVTAYDIPIKGNTLPKFTASAANGENVTVKETGDIEAPVIISLNSSETPEYKKYYVVNYKQIKELEPINGRKRYKVYNYAVSAVPEPQNPDWAMCDGDITTKWLGDGDGEWAMCDLGDEQQIGAFALAFDYGQQRIYYFDILVSSDGENYTQVYSGQSSGTTNELEIYEITPVKAKYVKFVSHGNSTNMKTNVREFAALE